MKINGCTEDGQLNVDLLITRDSGGISVCIANLLGYYIVVELHAQVSYIGDNIVLYRNVAHMLSQVIHYTQVVWQSTKVSNKVTPPLVFMQGAGK